MDYSALVLTVFCVFLAVYFARSRTTTVASSWRGKPGCMRRACSVRCCSREPLTAWRYSTHTHTPHYTRFRPHGKHVRSASFPLTILPPFPFPSACLRRGARLLHSCLAAAGGGADPLPLREGHPAVPRLHTDTHGHCGKGKAARAASGGKEALQREGGGGEGRGGRP